MRGICKRVIFFKTFGCFFVAFKVFLLEILPCLIRRYKIILCYLRTFFDLFSNLIYFVLFYAFFKNTVTATPSSAVLTMVLKLVTTEKKIPNRKIHAAIVAMEAKENILFLPIFFIPCFTE